MQGSPRIGHLAAKFFHQNLRHLHHIAGFGFVKADGLDLGDHQINKLFIFVNYAVAGRNYELLHSDAIGEIYNSRWRIAIQKRSYNTEDIDDQGQTGFDKFGSRIYNNIIPGGG